MGRMRGSKDNQIRLHLWMKHFVILQWMMGGQLTAHPEVYEKEDRNQNEEEKHFSP
jgi:hypothetical protein